MEYISKPGLIPDITNNFNLEEMSWEFLNSCENNNFIFATADHPNPHLLPIVSIDSFCVKKEKRGLVTP